MMNTTKLISESLEQVRKDKHKQYIRSAYDDLPDMDSLTLPNIQTPEDYPNKSGDILVALEEMQKNLKKCQSVLDRLDAEPVFEEIVKNLGATIKEVYGEIADFIENIIENYSLLYNRYKSIFSHFSTVKAYKSNLCIMVEAWLQDKPVDESLASSIIFSKGILEDSCEDQYPNLSASYDIKLPKDIFHSILGYLKADDIGRLSFTAKSYNEFLANVVVAKNKKSNNQNETEITLTQLKEKLALLPRLPGCLLKDLLAGEDFWSDLNELYNFIFGNKDQQERLLQKRVATLNPAILPSWPRLYPFLYSNIHYVKIALFFGLLTIEDFQHSGVINLLQNQDTAIPVLVGLYEKFFSVQEVKCFRHILTPMQSNDITIFFTPIAMTILKEKLLKVKEAESIKQLSALLTLEGYIALRLKLITPEQARKFYAGCDGGRCSELSYLLSPRGIGALRDKLITVEEAMYIPQLDVLLTPFGITALKEKLLTPKEASSFSAVFGHVANLKYLLTSEGITALRDKLFTPKEASEMLVGLQYLVTSNGLAALRENLITMPQAKKLTNYKYSALQYLLTDENLELIRINKEIVPTLVDNNYEVFRTEYGIKILAENLIGFSKLNKCYLRLLEPLMNQYGYEALKNKWVKPEIITHQNQSIMAVLMSENGIALLKEELITAEQAMKFTQDDLSLLLTKRSVEALRKPLFKADELIHIVGLRWLLGEYGLLALEKQLITTMDAKLFNLKSYKLAGLLTKNGVIALEEKLITIPDVLSLEFDFGFILTEVGLSVLRKQLISLQQKDEPHIRALLCTTGLKALDDELISVEQASAFVDIKALETFLRGDNLSLLADKYILITQLAELTNSQMSLLVRKEVSEAYKKGLIDIELIKVNNKPEHIFIQELMRNNPLPRILLKHG